MDRDRLKEVHATDLTESRVNEDFVDWMKNKGPSWLLVILLAVTGYLLIVRWKQHKQLKVEQAWVALADAALPGSKEDVADQHPDVFAVPELALTAAGSQLLRAVQTGQAIDAAGDPLDPTPADTPRLTETERDEYLTRADRVFARVADTDDGSLAFTLHAMQALNGRAAIAEARGEAAEAKRLYEAAAARAGDFYPALAKQARARAETVETSTGEVTFAEAAAAPRLDPPLSPAVIESAFQDVLLPPADPESR
jgi:hypothetical protein